MNGIEAFEQDAPEIVTVKKEHNGTLPSHVNPTLLSHVTGTLPFPTTHPTYIPTYPFSASVYPCDPSSLLTPIDPYAIPHWKRGVKRRRPQQQQNQPAPQEAAVTPPAPVPDTMVAVAENVEVRGCVVEPILNVF